MTKTARVALAVVTVLFIGVALREAWTDGITYDEMYAMTSGVAGLTRHDLRLTPQHPPLGKSIAAIPLLFMHPTIPRGAAWNRRDGGKAGAEFVHTAYVQGRLHRDVFAARVIPVLLTAATAWLIAILAASLFGSTAGVFAALLWLINPFIIGIGHLDGIDMPAAFTTVLTALAVLRARRKPSTGRIITVGVCGGLALLARVTGLIVVPTAMIAVATPYWRTDRRRMLINAAMVAGVSWLTVMVAYALLSPVDIAGHGNALVWPVTTLAHIFVPPDWLRGTLHLSNVGNKPGPSFVLGQMHTGRWFLYWPGSLLVKLPPTTLAVMIAGPFAWIGLSRATRRDAGMAVALPAIAHTLFTVQQQRPIGLRYELPGLALWIIAASPIVAVVTRAARVGIVTVAISGALVACIVTPSIAWTDPLLGPSYQQATDSNLDWGQAFPALVKWSRGREPWVSYFGNPGLTWQDVPGARDLATAPDDMTGWVAVSASNLTAYKRSQLGWLRAYCPVDVLERSILIYHFTTPPDRKVAAPEKPASLCKGTTSVLAHTPQDRARRSA